jgi:hypothetical protein
MSADADIFAANRARLVDQLIALLEMELPIQTVW